MFNKVSYDPTSQDVYGEVFALLDEIIALFDQPAIQIGHDDVIGCSRSHD